MERRGPSTSLRSAQDDGCWVGSREELLRQVQERNDGFPWLKGSSGFGGVDTFGVLRLRCASLRMTGCWVGSREELLKARAKAEYGLSWLKGSSGFGGVDTFGVLRLRCAPLRMTGCWVGSREELPRQERIGIRAFLVERFERFWWCRYLRGPSAALRFAQDDGVLGGFERRTTPAGAKAE
jgi:hypothetical protein